MCAGGLGIASVATSNPSHAWISVSSNETVTKNKTRIKRDREGEREREREQRRRENAAKMVILDNRAMQLSPPVGVGAAAAAAAVAASSAGNQYLNPDYLAPLPTEVR